MEPDKNNSKTAAGLEMLGRLVQKTVSRWTAESPKTYRVITDISSGVAIASTLIMLIPITYPAWVIPAAAILAAITSKLTVK